MGRPHRPFGRILDEVAAATALVAAEHAFGLREQNAVADVEPVAEQGGPRCVLREGDVVEADGGAALIAVRRPPADMLDGRSHALSDVAVERAVTDVARAVAVHVQRTGIALLGLVGKEAGCGDVDGPRGEDGRSGMRGVGEADADAGAAARAAGGDVVRERRVLHVDGIRRIGPERGATGAVGGNVVLDHRSAQRQRAASALAALDVAGKGSAIRIDGAAAAEVARVGEALRRVDRLIADELRANDVQAAELGVERAAQPRRIALEGTIDDGHLRIAAGEDGATADTAAVGQELAVEDFQFALVADLDGAAAPGARVVGVVRRRLHGTAVLHRQVTHRQRAAGVHQEDSGGLAAIQGDASLPVDHRRIARTDRDRTVDGNTGLLGTAIEDDVAALRCGSGERAGAAAGRRAIADDRRHGRARP